MAEIELSGAPASPGVAIGPAWRPAEVLVNGAIVPPHQRRQELDSALAALSSAAAALNVVAAELAAGEAEIVEAGALMAADPALLDAVEAAITADGQSAACAITRATDAYADAIAAVDDDTLAARADDVRSLGRRAARLVSGAADGPPGSELVLVAHDLGPADVAELAPVLAGVVLGGSGPTAHCAIVARSLGIPMVTGVGERVLDVRDGDRLSLDGTRGSVVLDPSQERASLATGAMRSQQETAARARAEADLPAVTIDGRSVAVLANVASAAELRVGLAAGAEGIGLLRTELAFLHARDWPSEQEHTDALRPILAGLGERRAVVRVLDFGADKSPPFLEGTATRGVELLLEHEAALLSQLRAILVCSRRHHVEILLPMVDRPEQVTRVRALLEQAARELGVRATPALGSMIETPQAASRSAEIADRCAFLSIGTNDLTAATVGADRFASSRAQAHDPRVLRLIAQATRAAHDAGIPIEVCGEAASDPLMLPILVGLGVDELSVGAAQVGSVRVRTRGLRFEDVGRLASSALELSSAEEVQRSVEVVRAAQMGL